MAKEDVLLLVNHDKWGEGMEIDLSTGAKKFLERIDYDNLQLDGHYALVMGDTIMFYRKNGLLHIRVNDRELCLEDERVHLTFERHGRDVSYVIYVDNSIFYSATYPSFRYRPPYDDPNVFDPFFYGGDREENEDILLLIVHVMNNPGLRKRIYTPESTWNE